MGKIECEHKWIDKGAYNECSLCGEIRLKHSTTVNGIICDDVEKGNYRFCQSEDEVEQSDVPAQNDKHD